MAVNSSQVAGRLLAEAREECDAMRERMKRGEEELAEYKRRATGVGEVDELRGRLASETKARAEEQS